MIRPEVEFYWPKVGDLFTKPCDISLLQFLYIGDSMLYCYIPQSKNSGFSKGQTRNKKSLQVCPVHTQHNQNKFYRTLLSCDFILLYGIIKLLRIDPKRYTLQSYDLKHDLISIQFSKKFNR